MNLLKIIPKLSKSIKSDNLQNIYTDLIHHNLLSAAIKSISPNDIVKLIFGIHEYKKGNHNIQEVFNQIDVELYAFSLVYFENDDPEITCDSCDGRGKFDCDDCSGSGERECDYCDGEGTVEDEEGDSEDCSYCRNGFVSCDNCDDGDVECYDCDGSGEVESSMYTRYVLDTFISYDRDLYNKLEIINNSNVPLDDTLISEIYSKCLMINQNASVVGDDFHTARTIDQGLRGETHINNISEILDFVLEKYDLTLHVLDLEDLELDKFS